MLTSGVFIQQRLRFGLSGIRIEFPECIEVSRLEDRLGLLAALAELGFPQPEDLNASLGQGAALQRRDRSPLAEPYVVAGIASRSRVERIQQQRPLEFRSEERRVGKECRSR